MNSRFEVIGVYPIDAPEPCHLIEVLLSGDDNSFDWGEVTQEDPTQPKYNWQVAYDEQLVEENKGESRYVFFFHYLDFSKPLITPFGEINLPKPTALPARLADIEYYPPG